MVVINSAKTAAVNFARSASNKVYQVVKPVGVMLRYAGQQVEYYGNKASNFAKRTASKVGGFARHVGNTIVSTFKKVGKAAVDTGKSIIQTGGAMLKSGIKSVKGAANTVAGWFGFRRRRRSGRSASNTTDATGSSSGTFAAGEQVTALIAEEDEEVMNDAILLMSATRNVREAATSLYFNVTDGVPLDIGALAYPDIEAKHRPNSTGAAQGVEAEAFASTFATVQHLTSKKVDLDAQIETVGYLMNTAGLCLLDGTCDLQDDVDRYEIALELMAARRNDIVFGIVEDLADLGHAVEHETTHVKGAGLSLSLPDAPSLDDLAQQLGQFDDARKAAVLEAGAGGQLVTREALVYYNVTAQTNPGVFMDLLRTGVAHVSVEAPPAATVHRNARMVGQDVRGYVFPAIAAPQNRSSSATTTLRISKGSWSAHVPVAHNAEPTIILHTDTTKAYTFTYDSKTCADVTFPCAPPACVETDDPFMNRASPYGEWRLEIQGGSPEWQRFTGATHIRLVFKVRWQEDTSTEPSAANTLMFGGQSCHGATPCVLEDGTPPVAPDECVRVAVAEDEAAPRERIIAKAVDGARPAPANGSTGGVMQVVDDAASAAPASNSNNVGAGNVSDRPWVVVTSTEVPTRTMSAASASTSAAEEGAASDGADNSTGVMVGIVVAVLLCCVVLVAALAYKSKKDGAQKYSDAPAGLNNLNYEFTETPFESFDGLHGAPAPPAGNIIAGDDYLGIVDDEDAALTPHFVGAMTRTEAVQLLEQAGNPHEERAPKLEYTDFAMASADGRLVDNPTYNVGSQAGTMGAGNNAEAEHYAEATNGNLAAGGADYAEATNINFGKEHNHAQTISAGAEYDNSACVATAPEYAEANAVHGNADYDTAANINGAEPEYDTAANVGNADYDVAANTLGDEPEYSQASNEQFEGFGEPANDESAVRSNYVLASQGGAMEGIDL